MKTVLFIGSLLIAGTAVSMSSEFPTASEPDPVVTSATYAPASVNSTGVVSIERIGIDGQCLLTHNIRSGEVEADVKCSSIYGPLGGVSSWNEESDGSVVLTDANGNAVVVLGLADGHAYESVIPASAMLIAEPVRH